MNDDHDSEETEPQPPSAVQVARRALILAVVSCRGILELQPDRDEARKFWDEVVPWWKSIDLEADLEPEKEQTVLASPELRAATELAEYANVAFTVHGRLRDFWLSCLVHWHASLTRLACGAYAGPLDRELVNGLCVSRVSAARAGTRPR